MDLGLPMSPPLQKIPRYRKETYTVPRTWCPNDDKARYRLGEYSEKLEHVPGEYPGSPGRVPGDPTGSPGRPRGGPESTQKGSRGLPKAPQGVPREPQETPKVAPRTPLGTPRGTMGVPRDRRRDPEAQMHGIYNGFEGSPRSANA